MVGWNFLEGFLFFMVLELLRVPCPFAFTTPINGVVYKRCPMGTFSFFLERWIRKKGSGFTSTSYFRRVFSLVWLGIFLKKIKILLVNDQGRKSFFKAS